MQDGADDLGGQPAGRHHRVTAPRQRTATSTSATAPRYGTTSEGPHASDASIGTANAEMAIAVAAGQRSPTANTSALTNANTMYVVDTAKWPG